MLERILDRTSSVALAVGASLLLGLFFSFVWAPHPWGWQGIDQYHELALRLARGEPFATTDVPWGYAYFAAVFYRLFGPRVWVPILAQVILNSAAPWLLYHLVRPWATQRVAVLASLLTGIFSFNNIYASTQASDALCTVLFLCSLLVLSRAILTRRAMLFAAAGFLAGVVPQFRPNMVLFPAFVALIYVLWHRRVEHVRHAVLYAVMVIAALAPWMVRNYRLTELFLPTSTHGGVQLWYGTLQVGPYLESRAHNPRSIFESPSFHYTSLAGVPIEIDTQRRSCPAWTEAAFTVHYWTDRDSVVRTAPPSMKTADRVAFEVPGQPLPTTLYYYFEARWLTPEGAQSQHTPISGPAMPFVYFVSDDHLGDLDRHDDVIDVFDLIRAALAPDAAPDAALQRVAAALLPSPLPAQPLKSIGRENGQTIVVFGDDSSWRIPASFSGRITDIEVHGAFAGAALTARRHTNAVDLEEPGSAQPRCLLSDAPSVNGAFYRREPHMMGRYMALAYDNIRRDYGAFIAASAYRALRLFIIRGTSDAATAHQFGASGLAYAAGTALSAAYFMVFLAGTWLAWRRRSALLWLLVPIVYVPLTISFVLTNMRYTVTVQPLMFVFVALVLVWVWRLEETQPAASREGNAG